MTFYVDLTNKTGNTLKAGGSYIKTKRSDAEVEVTVTRFLMPFRKTC